MNRRTTSDPNSEYFESYGGRGITVCERWKDFPAFYANMGKRPSKNHSLGRINNDEGYNPGNCKWMTKRQQQRDRRGNHKYEAIRIIRAYIGRDITLREVTHQALAKIRQLPARGRDARTPENIIAAFMLWLDEHKNGGSSSGSKRAARVEAISAKRKPKASEDQEHLNPLAEPEPFLAGTRELKPWELNVARQIAIIEERRKKHGSVVRKAEEGAVTI
jgi:hypothetical protein